MALSARPLPMPAYFAAASTLQFSGQFSGQFAGLQFAGRRTPRALSTQTHSEIDAKTAQLRDGLEALVRWDAQEHRIPCIQRLDIPSIVKNTQAFLLRQAQNPPHLPYPFMIGITGKTAAGKSTVTENWLGLFNEVATQQHHPAETNGQPVEEIKLDMFYHNFSERRQKLGEEQFFSRTNLDSPRAMSIGDAQDTLADLKNGRTVRTPHYSFIDGSRQDGSELKSPAPFVIAEGLFALHTRKFRDLMELKVFVDIDAQTQAQRWWGRAYQRDPHTPQKALQALFDQGLAMQEKYITPQKQYADLVLNGAAPQYQGTETLRRLSALLMSACYPQPELAPQALN